MLSLFCSSFIESESYTIVFFLLSVDSPFSICYPFSGSLFIASNLAKLSKACFYSLAFTQNVINFDGSYNFVAQSFLYLHTKIFRASHLNRAKLHFCVLSNQFLCINLIIKNKLSVFN
jgi:hypothetical protein